MTRPTLVVFAAAVALFAAASIVQFGVQLDRTIAYFDIEDEKKLIETALSYIKAGYQDAGADASERERIRGDFEFVNARQAYIWVFDAFTAKIRSRTIWSSILFSAGLLAVVFSAYAVVIRRIGKPVQEMLASLALYSQEGRIEEARVTGPPGMRISLRRFNDLISDLRRKTVEDGIRRSMENWQGTARIILHEVKNKLTPVRLMLDELLQEGVEPDRRAVLALLEKTGSITALITKFKDLSALPQPRVEEIDPRLRIEGLVRTQGWNGRVTIKGGCDGSFHTDPLYFETVIVNLVKNGLEAGGDGGRVDISLEARRIVIRDNGSGVPAECMQDLFKPGFTTKAEGNGMGLFIVRELCRIQGLGFTLSPHQDGGMEARVELGCE